MDSKEIWTALWAEAYDDAIDRGLSEKDATEYAEKMANSGSADFYADAIDDARQRRKDGCL